MGISAQEVKELREKTGAGMMDCKKALTEAEGDFARAEKILKEMGLAVAEKRSGRATNEGAVFAMTKANRAVILELASETDFVAKNETFQETGRKIAERILDNGYTEVNNELTTLVQEAISIIKENITLKRFKLVDIAENEYVKEYLHNKGEIGILVKLALEKPELKKSDIVQQYAFDCALHAAAFNPVYLNKDQVDDAYMKEQEEIFTTQAKNTGKPDNVLPGIVKGKLNKHLQQICFVDQPFVKDDKMSVSEAGKAAGKEAGGKIELVDYVYYEVGQE